jgi:SAM-dependent methyltransferase
MQLFQKLQTALRKWRYPGSFRYWERRYAAGGNSGAGSAGVLAAYKARIVNEFVKSADIQSVVELGCGDGQQLLLAHYPQYTGLDIAPSAIAACRRLHGNDAGKHFGVYNPFSFNPEAYASDMALSMEVIFHLTEEESYQLYLQHLFACARKWVLIFASNAPDTTGGVFPHFKPRPFLADVPPGWQLRQQLPNPHADISISEFFFFEKTIYPKL